MLLCTTLAYVAGVNLVFSGLTLVVIASQTERGTAPLQVGLAFSMAAVGGIVGAVVSSRVQGRLSPAALVFVFGWVATSVLAGLSITGEIYLVGALLAIVFLVATPANGMLFAVQIQMTPPELQGRVVSAALLAAGLASPLGPLIGGFSIEHFGQTVTFLLFAGLVALLTVAMHLNPSVRTMQRPGAG